MTVLTFPVMSQQQKYSVNNPAPKKEYQKKWYFSRNTGLIGAADLDFFLTVSTSPYQSADTLLLAEQHDPQQGHA